MPAQKHKVFLPPSETAIPIWRYMDFTKFVSMLENQGLFFSRADKLDDPFEGSYSLGNKNLRHEVYKEYKISESAFKTLSQFRSWVRKWTMVNCWHINTYESAAMWKLYTKSNEAIAVKSTYQQLWDCLDSECFVGIVQYIDYESAWLPEGNLLYPFVYKRLSFSHEQELRAVIQKLPSKGNKTDFSHKPSSGGTWKSVDLKKLINEVYVAPMSPSWYLDLVTKIVLRYGLLKPVVQSSLDHKPFY